MVAYLFTVNGREQRAFPCLAAAIIGGAIAFLFYDIAYRQPPR